jgi:hypothetical protein
MRRTSRGAASPWAASSWRRLGLAFLLAGGQCFAEVSAPGGPPEQVDVRYAVSFGEARVFEEHDRFQRQGERYTIVSEAKPVGVAALFLGEIRRESSGTIVGGRLRPDRYVEDRGRRGRRAATFDWQAGRITLQRDEQQTTQALAAGTLDQSSFRFSFMADPPGEREIVLPLTDGRRVKDYRYRFVGRETVTTPLGAIEALRYARVLAAEDDRAFDVWLAPAYRHLPVRIRYAEGSRVFDSVVTAIDLR